VIAMKQVFSIMLVFIKGLAYALAWIMELLGKLLITTSESILKLRK